ncbi:MAG: acyl carrier protein [Clostridiales bacterium]|nr:acyl carrier protein [Clostridiales bacterium]
MVLDKIRELIAENLGKDIEEISAETSLTKDLEADSIDAVEIIMAIEDWYDIEIPDEEAERFKTVADIVAFVEDNIEE